MAPRLFRILLNLYPPYLFSRTRVRSISKDWREIVVELPKGLLTRNYVGTTFGGSLYAAADPFFMIMLIKILGLTDYIVWDKGAVIDFKKPARSKVTYRFRVTDDDLARIDQDLTTKGKTFPEFEVAGVDQEGETCLTVRKILYVKKKEAGSSS